MPVSAGESSLDSCYLTPYFERQTPSQLLACSSIPWTAPCLLLVQKSALACTLETRPRSSGRLGCMSGLLPNINWLARRGMQTSLPLGIPRPPRKRHLSSAGRTFRVVRPCLCPSLQSRFHHSPLKPRTASKSPAHVVNEVRKAPHHTWMAPHSRRTVGMRHSARHNMECCDEHVGDAFFQRLPHHQRIAVSVKVDFGGSEKILTSYQELRRY